AAALRARSAAARLYRRGALTIVVGGGGAMREERLRGGPPIRGVDGGGKSLRRADLAPPRGPVALDAAQFVAHTDSSRVVIQGNPAGFTVSEIRRPPPDSLVYAERSNLANGAFRQQTTIVMEPASGTVRQVDQVTTQGGQTAETHLTYAGGRVKGASAAPQPDGSVKRVEIDTALPPGTVDENAVPFVVPALPLV